MPPGRLTAQKQRKLQAYETLSSPLGVKRLVSDVTADQIRKKKEEKFGPMESVLTTGQQRVVGRLSAGVEKVTGSSALASYVSRGAAPIKAGVTALYEANQAWKEKPALQRAQELPEITKKVGMAFVQGINSAVLRFVKSGTELVAGRETTEKIASNPLVSKFAQDITGRTPEEKIMTFQQIGEAVHADAIAQGATEEGAQKLTTLAVIGAVFAENPIFPGRGVTKDAAKFIANSTNPSEIKTRLLKEFPNFPSKATDEQIDIVSNLLVNIDDVDDVQTILNRTGFAISGRLSKQKGQAPVVQQKLSELSRQPEKSPALPSPTATTPKTLEIPTPVTPTEGKGSASELEALAKEARKYKTAEEFVRKQSPVFRGGSSLGFDATKADDMGVSVSTDRKIAQSFMGGESGLVGKSRVDELYISPEAKVLSIKTDPSADSTLKQLIQQWHSADEAGLDNVPYEKAVVKYAKDSGFDAVDLTDFGEKEIRIVNPQVLQTKGQLTDFYNRIISESAKDTRSMAAQSVQEGNIPEPKEKAFLEEAKKYKSAEEWGKSFTEKSLREYLNQTGSGQAKTASPTATGSRTRKEGDYLYAQDRDYFNALLNDIQNGRNFNSGVGKEISDIWNKAQLPKSTLKALEPKKKTTPTVPKYTPEDYSLDEIAQQEAKGEYQLTRSELEEARTTSNLEAIFADLKGVEVKDLQAKFTTNDLETAKLQREFLDDAIRNDPAGGLVKYMSRATGRLPEITGKPTMQSVRGGKPQTLKNSKYGQKGDDINQTIFGRAMEPGEAQKALDQHLEMIARRKEFDAKLSEISHNIRLAKAKDLFIGKEKTKLARELATNLASLRAIVQAAERAGFRKGLKAGVESTTKKFTVVLNKNKERRLQLQRIKHQYNLSDTEWSKIRRQPQKTKEGKEVFRDLDYRELDDETFSTYLKDVGERAEARHERNIERIIVDAIIAEKDLKRVENLQVAMELPHMNKMSASELRKFADQLNSTEAGGEYLPARMMQTIRNTDIGDAKTIGEAQERVAKQTNMPMVPVMGNEIDGWLRLPTLAARDPLHKLFVTDWIGSMAEMRSKKFQFKVELNSLKRAANASRKKRNAELRKQGALKQTARERIFEKLVPEDKLVSQYLQPFTAKYSYFPNGQVKAKEIEIDPVIRDQAMSQMTKEEIAYAKFLERFFSSKWEQVAREAQIRWTLRGVKHSNYRGEVIESVYLPHATRGYLERWRDDGFFSTVRSIFKNDLAESKVDFNAFGDRGKVLGYEKWLRNNMVRRAEGTNKKTGETLYSLNTAKVAEIYFEALEKKLVLDSLIPKVKLYEYLLGKRLQTPKHIGDPEGSEQVNSMLTEHINKMLNTLKGQKAGGITRQGGSFEGAINALKIWISVKYLGVNVVTQMISGVGAQATSFAGIGLKAWTKGQIRAKTRKGASLAHEYAGVVGDPPWFEIAKSSNDAGDLFMSGMFYGFGSLQYRAQRQMFLGMLTKEEWVTGNISKARQTEMRLKIGEWHPMSGDESIQGATHEMKLVTMFMSWAFPAIQTTYYKNLPRVINMVRKAKNAEDAKTIIKTDEFQTLYRTVILGAATAAFAYWVFNPDKNDKSQMGYMRKRAAEELSTVLQAITLWGIPVPGAIVVGYLETVQNALRVLLSGARYTEAGPGYAAGDLKAPNALAKAFVPSGIIQLKKMVMGEPETPVKTKQQLKKEVLEKIENGEMSVSAAQDYYLKQVKNIEKTEKSRRFEMPEKEYKKDLADRIKSKKVSIEDAKKEYVEYQKQLKEYAPEKFESSSDATFIKKIQIAAKAIGTDPVTLFQAIFTGEEIRRMDNGKIILHRAKSSDPQAQREWAIEKRKEFGANADLKLDHTVPLQLGGDNSDENLKLVPTEEWENYTPVENYLGLALRNKEITAKKAADLIVKFKTGEMTEEQVYLAVESD